MTAEQRVEPLRIPRSAGERLVEVAAELDALAALLRAGAGAGYQSCRWAGAIAWRMLVVREMVRASPAQAAGAGEHLDAVERALDAAVAAAGWGMCRDCDEALSDLRTVLADVDDEVRPGG